VRIALAQINPTVGDFTGNTRKIIEFARRAQQGRAALVLFPELCVCGYPPRDLVEKPGFVVRCRQALEEIAAETRAIVCVCGFVSRACRDTGKSVMNSAAVLRDGGVALVQSKRLLPTYDVFDEMRNFAHHLRGCLERQNFLEPPPLQGRPGRRTHPRRG
jgi:NAD+ synthase/NAD+ synthase (glutamine-hydrolysing)